MVMKKRYISVDIESSGQYPWNSSMVSFGACVVDGKFNKTFYAELKPITEEYLYENFKICASQLKCLKDYGDFNFNPQKVLRILKEKGEEPRKIIPKFHEWILSNSINERPVLVSDNNQFDGMFMSYYFSNFNNNINPFGYSSESINSIFRRGSRKMSENIKNLKLSPLEFKAHNAQTDAINQGIKFYNLLREIGHKF